MQPNPKPRLERLLRHLDTTPNALAKRLGMSQSYLSRILDGTRGNGPHGPVLLVQKAHAKLGLSPRYWSDAAARDPGEYMGAEDERVARELEPVRTVFDHRGALADLANLAIERDDPADVVKGTLQLQPPLGAGVAWYVREYLRLLEEHGGTRR